MSFNSLQTKAKTHNVMHTFTCNNGVWIVVLARSDLLDFNTNKFLGNYKIYGSLIPYIHIMLLNFDADVGKFAFLTSHVIDNNWKHLFIFIQVQTKWWMFMLVDDTNLQVEINKKSWWGCWLFYNIDYFYILSKNSLIHGNLPRWHSSLVWVCFRILKSLWFIKGIEGRHYCQILWN